MCGEPHMNRNCKKVSFRVRLSETEDVQPNPIKNRVEVRRKFPSKAGAKNLESGGQSSVVGTRRLVPGVSELRGEAQIDSIAAIFGSTVANTL